MLAKMKIFQFVSLFMTYVMQQLGNCETIWRYLQRNSSTFFHQRIWTYFEHISRNQSKSSVTQSKFNKFELLSYFDALPVTPFPLTLLYHCLASHQKLTQFWNVQGRFSNPWTFHNIAGLRLYDAAGIYKEPWSWLWQRKRGPQHAEVPGHCQ